MSTQAAVHAERFARALGRASSKARYWLRPEAWNAEGRRRMKASVRAHPRRAAGIGAAALAAAAGLFAFFSGGVPEGIAVAEAREGPFHLTIVETGTLQALRSVTYASSIQSNQAKIVAIVPEGKLVEKEDLLILFDAAPF